MKVLYFIIVILLAIYSYALVDPNMTFFNSVVWTDFRNVMVLLGYYQRMWSSILYIGFVVALFAFHHYFVRQKVQRVLQIAFVLAGVSIIAYPFLSHDFFNYLFDEKILTFYHVNPYHFKALDFQHDQWLRFLQWTHRTYPYGPTFLLVLMPASFLSFGKFALSFLFVKITYAFLFVVSVWCLNKINKQWAVLYATHPLIILEGLVNSHNDFIALALAIISWYFFLKKKDTFVAVIYMFISAGIKYITVPLFLILLPWKKGQTLALLGIVALILIASHSYLVIQPWYFLALFAFIPFFPKLIPDISIFLAGLLFSYYPYIRYDGWAEVANVQMKHIIILVFLILNVVWLFVRKMPKFARLRMMQ